jgi:hypothetical protein
VIDKRSSEDQRIFGKKDSWHDYFSLSLDPSICYEVRLLASVFTRAVCGRAHHNVCLLIMMWACSS